jgi:hypothetical protein
MEEASRNGSKVTELIENTDRTSSLNVPLYGFRLKFFDKELQIEGIDVPSVAERMNLKVGDRITAINDSDISRYSGEKFKDLIDVFAPIRRVDMKIAEGTQQKSIILFPPFSLNIDAAGSTADFYYVWTDAPYRSELIGIDANGDQIMTFSFLTEFASIPGIEQMKPDLFSEGNYGDLDGNGISELKIEFSEEDILEHRLLWLTWKENHFEPFMVYDASGKDIPAVFETYASEKDKNQGKIFEMIDFQKDGNPELVSWNYHVSGANTSNKQVKVNASVYQNDNGSFRYNKVLSGQFERVQTLVILNE